ncbi:pyridoxamine 5'-phosphate oxidase family protein [Pseudonocardia xinjiangensis]|uniref:pyridoxamine 5'-phosphate oxidase family protein n=1 Tax=Pseudonocardia xinjiangensis TaxID=75289 RepID=UPI003D8EC626
MSFAMTAQERQEFLAGVHVGVVAVNRPERAPLAVPVWYDYEPGGDLLIWIDRGSVKERLFREAGRFSICAQVETPPYKYVTAEGPIVALDQAPTEEQALGIASRYLPEDEAVRWVKDNLGASSLLVRMRPEKWLSTDYGKA